MTGQCRILLINGNTTPSVTEGIERAGKEIALFYDPFPAGEHYELIQTYPATLD